MGAALLPGTRLAGCGRAGPQRHTRGNVRSSPAYLNEQLQALARAGIVSSTPGPKGGFTLARDPSAITVLDVVNAIEGTDEVFRCQEIRQAGMGEHLPKAEFRDTCVIAATMREAETRWRAALTETTIADIRATVDGKAGHAGGRMRRWLATGSV